MVNNKLPVIAWWSGGVTSAVTCKICIDWFGVENVRVIFIDTGNEDEDTYRFRMDCEKWYRTEIEVIRNPDYNSIHDVWYRHQSLNVANGAICSYKLKRVVRERFQEVNKYSFQAFGFEIEELDRAKALKLNHPKSRPIFPLIANLLSKKDCVKIIQEANSLFLNIQLPNAYKLGYLNNNCRKTGCVQGGVGYWQKMDKEENDKVERMAKVEHDLTNLKGKPVTMLRSGKDPVFLRKHPDYPDAKELSMMKGRTPKPLVDCNGFCGTNDLGQRSETEKEINYSE